MTHDFYILGTVVGSDAERMSEDDLAPQNFKKFISRCQNGDELVLHINSCGGDVFGGISIANMIRELGEKGVVTVAVVEGLAASIASVIMCACQKIRMYSSSSCMIHRCWTVVQGNQEDLRREVEMMDRIDKAILSFYHNHFDLTDAELEQYMSDETWIFGNEIQNYKLNAEIMPEQKQFKIAAKLRNLNFKRIPKDLIMEEIKDEVNALKSEDEKKETEVEETEKKNPETEEQEETKQDEDQEEQEETEKPDEDEEDEAVKDMVPKAEVEKRVSGMQSVMAKKLDAMRQDFEAKITDFQNQLKLKDEELTSVKAEVTSLTQKLDESSKELQATVSALEEKNKALEMLNSRVNTPAEELPTMKAGLAKCKTSAEKVAFLKSGKYTK